MNGRELIIYIVENGLENVNLFSKEFFSFMLTIEQVAVKFNVGIATVKAWIQNGCLYAIKVDDVTYVTPDSLNEFVAKIGHGEVENV